MSGQQSGGGDSTARPDERFRDDSRQTVAEVFVEGTIEEQFAAERYSVDSTFEALAHPGQRYVLTYLLQAAGPVTLTDLVDYATSQREGSVDSNLRHQVAIELTHTVLPKLDDSGFLEYDMERQTIEPTEQTPVVEPYLRIALSQQELAADLRDN